MSKLNDIMELCRILQKVSNGINSDLQGCDMNITQAYDLLNNCMVKVLANMKARGKQILSDKELDDIVASAMDTFKPVDYYAGCYTPKKTEYVTRMLKMTNEELLDEYVELVMGDGYDGISSLANDWNLVKFKGYFFDRLRQYSFLK